MTSPSKFYWQKKANSIDGLITSIYYGSYDPVQFDILRSLTNMIYRAGKDEWTDVGFSIGSHPDYIFKRLEKAYSTSSVREEVMLLLLEYERYEILAELTKI